ncbi:MAG: phasin family protein [Betaproteobacteria bacterium]|nr:phasin family protein [Betaproteobacteria bacterium]MDE2002720.1 phasin family protein [Betaproteobacteria bacterium]MDE2208523.1 phasin family protein [Betaproteobacteria bacterium]MDE2358301.1 phasin family protein [Betaproteobacteria bacterium]
MARKAAPAAAKTARKRPARKRSAPPKSARAPKPASGATAMHGFGDMAKMPKMMTPEQAIDLYKANAALALDVINTAIEGAARLRRKQFEGEEQARDFQKRHARSAAEARDAQGLMAAGQGAAQEAMEKSMHYWGEMFDLIVEIQKRLFTLIDEQMEGVPGVKESRAAMAMLPDLRQMQKVVSAMQGVVTSGGSTFETMQRVMGDFAKLAQGSMPGASR